MARGGREGVEMWARGVLVEMKLLLPGVLSGLTNTDVAAVVTYTQSGSQYGLAAVKFQVLSIPVMYAFQEMAARIGVFCCCGVETKKTKGVLRLTRELLGEPWAACAGACLLAVCASTLFCEAAGMVAVADVLNVRRAYVVLGYSGVLAYNLTCSSFGECFALALSSALGLFVFLAAASVRDIGDGNVLSLNLSDADFDSVVVSGTFGTALTPFLLFYQCAATVRGGAERRDMPRLSRNIGLGVGLASLSGIAVTVSSAFRLWNNPDARNIRSIQDCGYAFQDSMGHLGILLFVSGLTGAALTASFCTLETIVWICADISGVDDDDLSKELDAQLRVIQDIDRSRAVYCGDALAGDDNDDALTVESPLIVGATPSRRDSSTLEASRRDPLEACESAPAETTPRVRVSSSPSWSSRWRGKALGLGMLAVVDVAVCLLTDRQTVNLEIFAQDLGCCLLPPSLALAIFLGRKVVPLDAYSPLEFNIHVTGALFFSAAAVGPLLVSALIEAA